MRARISLLLVLALGLRVNQAVLDFNCDTRKTSETAEGGDTKQDGLFYLDRQTVDCGANSVLSSFQLKRGAVGTFNIYYEYTCCSGTWVDSTISYNVTTQFQDGTRHFYLDRTKVSCNTGYSLNKFHLQRGAAGTGQEFEYQYVYTCVKTNVASCTNVTGDYQEYGDRLYFLDRINANCTSIQGGSQSVMREWYIEEDQAKKNPKWRYDISCCPAITLRPSTRLDFATIQLQSQDNRCVTWSNVTAGNYYPVGLGDCGANSNNLWYADPFIKNGDTFLKLYPYPPSIDSTYYLQDQSPGVAGVAAVGVSAPGSPGVQIEDVFKRVTFSDGWLMAVSGGNSVVATQNFLGGSDYNYYFKAVKVFSPLTIPNMGEICKNLNRFGWNEAVCPFPAVTGTGGKNWSSQLQYIGSKALAGMGYAKDFIFYVKELGNVGDNAGAQSLLAAFAMVYDDLATSDDAIPSSVDLKAMKTVTCSLDLLEYLISLQILPVTTGPLDSRGIAGLKWVTNTGKVCSVPSSIANDPIWSSIPEIKGPDLGNGIPYGAVAGYTSNGYIGSLGLITYEMFESTLTLPQWSVAAANSMFSNGSPNQLSTIVCNNMNGTANVPCKLSFTLSRANQNTLTNAYTSSSTTGKTRAFGCSETLGYKFGASYKVGVLLTEASASQEFSISASQTNTWTFTDSQTSQVADTTSTATTDTATTTCSFEPTVPPGQTATVSGLQTKGNFSIPWSGTFSYILKGGAHFNFSAAGQYSAAVESGCYFDIVYATATPSPPPSSRSLLNTCLHSETCSHTESGTEVKKCECPSGTKCVPVRYGPRVDRVCRQISIKNQLSQATTVTVVGATCKKWHRVYERHLSLEYVSKDCNVTMTCLLEANSDFLKVYEDKKSPLRLLPKALGKYLDIGCFYPSRRPQFAKF